MKSLLPLVITLALVGCVHGPQATPGQPPKNPAKEALVALDTATCAAEDVLPGIPLLVGSLMERERPVAERSILGLISGIGAVGKGVACYLRAQAATRSQAGPAPGELGVVLQPDWMLIQNRAAACDPKGEGGACNRPFLLAAYLLVEAEKRGWVKVQ